jgi:hypothetical protein
MGDFHRQYNDPYKLPVQFYLQIEQKRIAKSSQQLGAGASFGGIPVYSAHFPSYQEGAAWYDGIVRFFRQPFVKNIGKKIGTQLLSTTGQIASDLATSAQNNTDNGLNLDKVGKIAKRRLSEAGTNLLDYGVDSYKKYRTGGGTRIALGCANWGVKKRRKTRIVRKQRSKRGKRVKKRSRKSYKKVYKGRIVKRKRRKRTRKTKNKKLKTKRRRRTRKRRSTQSVDDFFNYT